MAQETPSWLNVDFFENVLRKSKKDDSIRVIDIFTKPATSKGDNYASEMYRVAVEFSRKRADREVTEKRSLIVKVAPMGESIKREMIEKAGIFATEISMAVNTLKKMNDILGPEHPPLNAQVLHVQKEYPEFLVVEDLAILGFRMADRQAGLDLAHCSLALQGLARFHASSVALCEKEPSQKKLYTKGIFSSAHPPELLAFFSMGTKSLGLEVSKWPDYADKYADKIEKIADVIYDRTAEAVSYREDQFNVINHGDFWVNNMMFRYNEEGKPIGHISVDFQMCVYTTPALDLLYFFNTSANEEVFEHSMDRLLQEYYETLTSTMKQLGCETVPPTIEELRNDMKKAEIVAMTSSFTVLPLVVMDKSEARDLNEIMKNGAHDNPAYSGEIYRKVIRKRLPIYDRLGLMDL